MRTLKLEINDCYTNEEAERLIDVVVSALLREGHENVRTFLTHNNLYPMPSLDDSVPNIDVGLPRASNIRVTDGP